jgi:hypothetical protein
MTEELRLSGRSSGAGGDAAETERIVAAALERGVDGTCKAWIPCEPRRLANARARHHRMSALMSEALLLAIL